MAEAAIAERTALVGQVHRAMEQLPERLQERVLGYVQGLAASFPRGMSREEAMSLFGTMSPEEAQEMDVIIEEEFEKVDLDAW